MKYGKTKKLKPQKKGDGYFYVELCKDGKTKRFLVHRLVASAFIPNPQGYPCVNHRDENPSNNRVDNLEWCDHKYNMNFGTCQKRGHAKLVNGPLAKPVLQYDEDGNLIQIWPSIQEAKRQLGFSDSCICRCCNGKMKSAYDYIWRYA